MTYIPCLPSDQPDHRLHRPLDTPFGVVHGDALDDPGVRGLNVFVSIRLFVYDELLHGGVCHPPLHQPT